MRQLSILSLFFITVGLYSAQAFATSSAEKSNEGAAITVKKDFIVGIFRPMQRSYHAKAALIEDLEFLIQDEKNVGNLTEAYRQIEQSPMLSLNEKISWIERNQERLPAPFLILLSNYLAASNIDEAAKWYVVGSLRMELDARKCTEKDFTRGGNEIIMEKLIENLTANLKGNDSEDKMQKFSSSIKNQFESAVKFHQANPYKIAHPFWLSNHAFQAAKRTDFHVEVVTEKPEFVVNTIEEYSSFKPQNSWQTIEENVIDQLRKEFY